MRSIDLNWLPILGRHNISLTIKWGSEGARIYECNGKKFKRYEHKIARKYIDNLVKTLREQEK